MPAPIKPDILLEIERSRQLDLQAQLARRRRFYGQWCDYPGPWAESMTEDPDTAILDLYALHALWWEYASAFPYEYVVATYCWTTWKMLGTPVTDDWLKLDTALSTESCGVVISLLDDMIERRVDFGPMAISDRARKLRTDLEASVDFIPHVSARVADMIRLLQPGGPDASIPIQDLKIIGYQEVPAELFPEHFLPRELSPVFLLGDQTVLLPPYTLTDTELNGPMISTLQEFQELVDGSEASKFELTQAYPGHQLWMDDTGVVRYGPGDVRKIIFKHLANGYLGCSKTALQKLDPVMARNYAMISYSANPTNVQALVHRAAAEQQLIYQCLPDTVDKAGGYSEETFSQALTARMAELAMTEQLATAHVEVGEFRKWYLELITTLVANGFNMWLVINDDRPICAKPTEAQARVYASGFSSAASTKIVPGKFVPL